MMAIIYEQSYQISSSFGILNIITQYDIYDVFLWYLWGYDIVKLATTKTTTSYIIVFNFNGLKILLGNKTDK